MTSNSTHFLQKKRKHDGWLVAWFVLRGDRLTSEGISLMELNLYLWKARTIQQKTMNNQVNERGIGTFETKLCQQKNKSLRIFSDFKENFQIE